VGWGGGGGVLLDIHTGMGKGSNLQKFPRGVDSLGGFLLKRLWTRVKKEENRFFRPLKSSK